MMTSFTFLDCHSSHGSCNQISTYLTIRIKKPDQFSNCSQKLIVIRIKNLDVDELPTNQSFIKANIVKSIKTVVTIY